MSQWAYVKPKAVLVFQDALLAGGKSLRPVQDMWLAGQRIYRPPVEQLAATEPVRPVLDDPEFIASQLHPKSVLVKPASKSYRTGGGS